MKSNEKEIDNCIKSIENHKVLSTHTKRLIEKHGYERHDLEKDICKGLKK